MSTEYFAYSEDPSAVAVDDLLARCRKAGFECRVLRGQSESIASGPLASEDAIVGWKSSWFGNRKAGLAASGADWKTMDELQDRNVIGVCAIEIWDDPSAFNNDAEIEEARSVYGADYAAYRGKSRVRWYVRLASGSSGLSVALAEIVLKALLGLRGGLFEDPQSGECQISTRDERRA